MEADPGRLGWAVEDAPPEVARVVQWLACGRELVAAERVVLLCETATLETVYVEIRADRLVVSDRGDTCRYLEAGDGAHRPLATEAIRRLAAQRGARLVDVPDMWPHITAGPEHAGTVAEAVAVVAGAIEHVFAAALTVPAG